MGPSDGLGSEGRLPKQLIETRPHPARYLGRCFFKGGRPAFLLGRRVRRSEHWRFDFLSPVLLAGGPTSSPMAFKDTFEGRFARARLQRSLCSLWNCRHAELTRGK